MLFISPFWFPFLISWQIKIGNQKQEINNIDRLDSYQICDFQFNIYKRTIFAFLKNRLNFFIVLISFLYFVFPEAIMYTVLFKRPFNLDYNFC